MQAYKRYGRALLRKAERILQNREDARDIVQGVFVEMLQRGQTDADLAYLYRAVTTRCLNLVRDRKRRAELLARQDPALRGVVRTGCEEVVLGLDLLAKLARRLDRRSLEVIVCHYYDDMTQEETAAHLGISRKTVGKRLAKVRAEVRALAGGGSS